MREYSPGEVVMVHPDIANESRFPNILPGLVAPMRKFAGVIDEIHRDIPGDGIYRLNNHPFWWRYDWLVPLEDFKNKDELSQIDDASGIEYLI